MTLVGVDFEVGRLAPLLLQVQDCMSYLKDAHKMSYVEIQLIGSECRGG